MVWRAKHIYPDRNNETPSFSIMNKSLVCTKWLYGVLFSNIWGLVRTRTQKRYKSKKLSPAFLHMFLKYL